MWLDQFIHIFILLGGLLGLTLGMIHGLRSAAFTWTSLLGWTLISHALFDVYLWLYWTKTSIDLRLLILMPLNVVLIPTYFLFQYIRSFTGDEPGRQPFGRFLMVAACLELGLYLMPIGAALFSGAINKPVLLFAKSIRNTLTISSLPIVIATCLVLYQMIKRYKHSANQSITAKERIGWLYQLLTGLCVLYGLAQLPLLVSFIAGWRSRVLFYPLGIGSSLFLAWAGIRAFIIHERLSPTNLLPTNNEQMSSTQLALYDQMTQLIQREHLYKLPSLKLADIAGRLSISPQYLSRIVNQQAKKNFTDLINEHRVTEVKRMMNDPAFSNYTLEGLGREAGFGGKSTYQASFKRLTGLTPSQYRATQRPVS